MMIEYYSEEKLKKELTVIFSKYLDLTLFKLFFFGSRVTGNSNEMSDIDVGVAGPTPVDLFTIAEIEAEIEEIPTLYKIQVVDFFNKPDHFRSIALKHVEYIN